MRERCPHEAVEMCETFIGLERSGTGKSPLGYEKPIGDKVEHRNAGKDNMIRVRHNICSEGIPGCSSGAISVQAWV